MNMGLEDYDLREPERAPVQLVPMNYLPEHGSLKSLDLDAELYNSYAKAKNYLAEVQADGEVPPNQLAQLMNTITTILKEIVKMQTDLYNAERVKKLEAAMIQAIKLAPSESQQAFLEEYAKILAEADISP